MKNAESAYEPKLGKELKRRISQYLQYHPERRINILLRTLFMNYVKELSETFPSKVETMAWDLSELMELLDFAEESTRDRPEP
jgi:hypothetical protein